MKGKPLSKLTLTPKRAARIALHGRSVAPDRKAGRVARGWDYRYKRDTGNGGRVHQRDLR